MPSINDKQRAAFDAIDYLHFNQVMVGFISCEPAAQWWYPRIHDAIDRKLLEAGMFGKQAEITKHYLLAYLEIYLSFDNKCVSEMIDSEGGAINGNPIRETNWEKVFESTQKVSLSILCNIADINGVGKIFLERVAGELINDKVLALTTMPYFIRYRLTECCYALEYPDAPLDFYRELVSIGVISCSKYAFKDDVFAKKLDPRVSPQFIRAGLIFEFKMLQRSQSIVMYFNDNHVINLPVLDSKISFAERKDISNYYKRHIDTYFLEENENTFVIFPCNKNTLEESANILLEKMNKYFFHKRMFDGTQGSWLGRFGAFYIELSRGEKPGEAIYYSENNGGTISEKIKLKINEFGFRISARSLYLRHKTIKKDNYSKVNYYIDLLLKYPMVQPWHFGFDRIYEEALKFEGITKK